MNYFLTPSNNLKKLLEDWQNYERIIVGIDFDSTLVPYRKYEGEHCDEVCQLIRDLKEVCGTFNILWTANKYPDKCAAWCESKGIPIDAVNENAPEAIDYFMREGYEEPPRKLFFNILLDNVAGLSETFNHLRILVDLVKNGTLKKKSSFG
jgi:hypothetical protein